MADCSGRPQEEDGEKDEKKDEKEEKEKDKEDGDLDCLMSVSSWPGFALVKV